MTENKNLLTNLRFHTVDGLYLQENDVEHEDYVIIEDLTDWLDEHDRALTEADITELAMSGGHARRNYSIYEKFVDVTSLRNELTPPNTETASVKHMNIQPNQLAARIKNTETLWAIQAIDFAAKTVAYDSFGLTVTASFDDVDLVVCD